MKKGANSQANRRKNVMMAATACCVTMMVLGFASQYLVSAPIDTNTQADLLKKQIERKLEAEKKRKEEEQKKIRLEGQFGKSSEIIHENVDVTSIVDGEVSPSVQKPSNEDEKSISIEKGEVLLPGQCNADRDLNDPLVKAIQTPSSNADYLRIRKGGFGYPDFLFQCRERRFGNYLQWAAENSHDPDNSILDPSGRYYWCPSGSGGVGEHFTTHTAPHLSPLNTPAIPSLVEGVPTSEKQLSQPAQTDRSFETLIPLLKMSLRRAEYLKPIMDFQTQSISMPTPATGTLWAEGAAFDEFALGSSMLMDLWQDRFAAGAAKDGISLSHEEKLKRVIVVATWLLNRPKELTKHVLRMMEREKKVVGDISLNDFWLRVENFQLSALNITGRYRDETVFNNQFVTKHCQLDSHDHEKGSPDGRSFRSHRLENILNVRHSPRLAWDFCDLLTVDTFLRMSGLSIASTQDMEALFLFNARSALGSRNEPTLEINGQPNAKLQPTLVKVLPGASSHGGNSEETSIGEVNAKIAEEDTCTIDGSKVTLKDFSITTANASGGLPPTLCRFRHLARAFRKFHRLVLRMGSIASADRAAAHGLHKLFEEEGVSAPHTMSKSSDAAGCNRKDSLVSEWLHSLSRMDTTLKNIVPELQQESIYAADAATKGPLSQHTAPLMKNPMTELWTTKIDDSFIPLWSLTLWEQQMHELMSGPYAAAGLLMMDRRYRTDSQSFNTHPYTIALKKGTYINSKLQSKLGTDDEAKQITAQPAQKTIALAANQFILSPRGDPKYTDPIHPKDISPFGIDGVARTALAKIQYLRYGFIDLDELVEATAKGTTTQPSHSYLSATNALSTLARMLNYYFTVPFTVDDKDIARGVSGCDPFKKNAGANSASPSFEAMIACPLHPIHTEGFVNHLNLIYVLHRHPLATYTLKKDAKVSLGAKSSSTSDSYGFVAGVTHTPVPHGMQLNDDVAKKFPTELLATLRFMSFGENGAAVETSLPGPLASSTEIYAINAAVVDTIPEKAKDGATVTVTKDEYTTLLKAVRDLTWTVGLEFHKKTHEKLQHMQQIGITERFPSYAALVPLRWDTIFVPDNAILQFSNAPVYTAAAVIRRPMMWVGSEGNSLLARCVASNEPQCSSEFLTHKAQRDAAIANGFTSPSPTVNAASSLRYIPSSELRTAEFTANPLISLTEAMYQRFPMTVVNDMMWQSLSTGLPHMKDGLRRRSLPDPEMQVPLTSCIGLRDAHPFVQYALSNSYGEATVTAVSEDHHGGLVFAQPKGARPLQAHLSPSFFGLSGDDDSFEGAEVAARHEAFASVRTAMEKNKNKW